MQKILEKRASLHRKLQLEQQQNDQLKAKIERVESLANIGLVSAMVAHEVNNILTPLGSYAELALQNPGDEYLSKKAIEKAAKNSHKAAKILNSLLAFAGNDQTTKSMTNLQSIIEETIESIGRNFKKDMISVTIDCPSDLEVFCEPIVFQQVLMNLILNAREAMLGKGGKINLHGYNKNCFTVIEVCDTGKGIKQENLESIFEPFFSTKDRSDDRHNAGAGLGLAFCRKVIDAHDGSIEAISDGKTGTMFRMMLPLPSETIDRSGDQ